MFKRGLMAGAIVVMLSSTANAPAQAQSPDKLLSIAVFDFEVPNLASSIEIKGTEKRVTLSEIIQTNLLTNKFITELTKSKRLQVVERSRMDDIKDELDLSKSGATDPKRNVEIGKLLGAQLLLFGSVEYIEAAVETTPIPYTSRVRRSGIVEIGATIRIVDSEKGIVMAADSNQIIFEIPDLESNATLEGRHFQAAQEELVRKLTYTVLDEIFPVKVVLVQEGKVYINRGANNDVVSGERYRVIRSGEALVDPDTGISLGSAQKEIATIAVDEVNERMSIGHVVEWLGTEQAVVKGDICKPVRVPGAAEEAGAEGAKPSQVIP